MQSDRAIVVYLSMTTLEYMYIVFVLRFCFVCVEVLRPGQPNGVMLSAVSLPNHTFTGQT